MLPYKSKLILLRLFPAFSCVLSTILSSDEEMRGGGCSLLVIVVGIAVKKFYSFPVKST